MGIAPATLRWIEMDYPNLTMRTEMQDTQTGLQTQLSGHADGHHGEGILRLTPMDLHTLQRFMEGTQVAPFAVEADNVFEQAQLVPQRAVQPVLPHILVPFPTVASTIRRSMLRVIT